VPDPYAVFGQGYANHRQSDPRVAAHIEAALGGARTVVNVGAGAGAYEPTGRRVTAVEPSPVMIGQRPATAAPVVRSVAEQLPFADDQFDVGLAVLTVHHWTDIARGLAELRRVSRRQVILTWDQAQVSRFWLVADYLPEIAQAEADLAALATIRTALETAGANVRVTTVPVPADCRDGFVAAYWRRPEAYLDPGVRAAMSGLVKLDQDVVDRAMARLADDLTDGRWQRRHATDSDTTDAGYRLVVAD
jgi:SAM-dependent methyltransferase